MDNEMVEEEVEEEINFSIDDCKTMAECFRNIANELKILADMFYPE